MMISNVGQTIKTWKVGAGKGQHMRHFELWLYSHCQLTHLCDGIGDDCYVMCLLSVCMHRTVVSCHVHWRARTSKMCCR